MKYFVGTYENKVDGKGRVSLPSAFRDIITTGDMTAFYVFPSPVYDTLEAGGSDFMEFIAKSIEEQADIFSREEDTLNYIMQSAKLVSCDTTGRFVLPAEFCKFSHITTAATFVGAGRRFQIWSPDIFAKKAKNAREKFNASNITIKRSSN